MIKLTAVCFVCSLLFTNFFLQVVPPVATRPLISDGLWQTIVTVVGLVVVAWLNNRKSNKDKAEVKAEISTVKAEVKADVGEVKKEVTTLKENTDGHMTELVKLNREVSEKIGIEKGIEQSKIAHEAQSEKDKDANIAKGVLQGKEAAEVKAVQSSGLPPVGGGPIEVKIVHEEPVEVKIKQPEDQPTPVVIIEKPKDIH